jgi:hypothetical protein
MTTYNVIQIGSQREVLVGTVEASDEQEAIYNAVQEFGNSGEFSESDFRVEVKSNG